MGNQSFTRSELPSIPAAPWNLERAQDDALVHVGGWKQLVNHWGKDGADITNKSRMNYAAASRFVRCVTWSQMQSDVKRLSDTHSGPCWSTRSCRAPHTHGPLWKHIAPLVWHAEDSFSGRCWRGSRGPADHCFFWIRFSTTEEHTALLTHFGTHVIQCVRQLGRVIM